ncbi:Uncharacterized protein Adt_23762 [Abeliophyllum distichum]|uniref:Uncharacterized protein n=1 Tax=Abeliophyllum distichum TaxID=126358 RepID=A0ABD1SBS5_9LAMI
MPDDIDLRIVEADLQTSLIKELKSFIVDLSEPYKLLQVMKDLLDETKEALKEFLFCNLDVFALKHEDTVEIDLGVSYHGLNVDPKFHTAITRWRLERGLASREEPKMEK